jgi:hypothetical protein
MRGRNDRGATTLYYFFSEALLPTGFNLCSAGSQSASTHYTTIAIVLLLASSCNNFI